MRASCGDLIARDGESLVLSSSAVVDARRFEQEAAAAVRSAAAVEQAGLARAALARYGGDLLPADRYEAWASAPRERLRRRYLDLLDLLSDEAVERGDLDEAIRLLDQAQVAEPLDESRYVRAAGIPALPGPPRLRGGPGGARPETPRGPRAPGDPHAHPPPRRHPNLKGPGPINPR